MTAWRSSRLGIAVRARSVAAVLVRGERCVWQSHVSFDQSESVSGAIARLLSAMPPARVGRRRVVVAIGPHAVQTKRLHGLRDVARQRQLVAAVRENVDAMFLQREGVLVVPSILQTQDGATIAAAFELELLGEIAAVLRAKKLRLVTATPTVVALAALAPNDSFDWSDEDERLHMLVISRGGELHDVRRLLDTALATTDAGSPAAFIAAQAMSDYVDAYAAAVLRRRPTLGWRPERDPRHSTMLNRFGVAAAAASVTLAMSSAFLAPGLRARDVARRSDAALARTRDQRLELARLDGQLRRATDILDRVERFRAQRGGLTLLLGALSDALPESTAIVSLRVDTLEASFVSLAAHAVDVLPQLGGVSGIMVPRLVGPVTREMVGTTRLERATFRFRRRGAERHPMTRAATATSTSRPD